MTMRDLLSKSSKDLPKAEDYAPKKIYPNLDAVEQALLDTPIPNLKDGVVKSFIDMGANIAKDLRAAGQFCYEQGVKRQEEYEKAAKVAERKGEYLAREAGKIIDDFDNLRNIAQGTPDAQATPPPPDVANNKGTIDSPIDSWSNNPGVLPNEPGHKT